MAKYKVLSTKKLEPSLIQIAKQNGIEIIEQVKKDFPETKTSKDADGMIKAATQREELKKIQRALEDAGVEFLPRHGVRMSQSKEGK